MPHYCFDGTMTGLLSCVFRAFEFKEFDVKVTANPQAQNGLFDDFIHVASNESQGQRVWQGLKQKVSSSSLKAFYYAFFSEKEQAFQNLFDFAVYVFQNQRPVDKDYGHHAVIGMSQWCKQVGREKHRMEAFVRFKKAKDGSFLSLVKPDFNVLPIISRHFKERYQDQRWLIYDEQRQYGIYYDLHDVHQIEMNAEMVDPQIRIGHSQSFSIELDDEEVLYDQLWKDYFKSVNIQARQNMKLHIQYVPKRYWRYMNEKVL